jgi:hypothetical protein
MAAAGVASLAGKVASGALRWKTTVLSSGALTVLTSDISDEGPVVQLIFCIRSMENFTSCAVTSWPLENFSPSCIVHWYVRPEVSV